MKNHFTVLLIFFSLQLFAQSASIEGIAYDNSAQTPLEFASVSLYQSADSALLQGQIAKADGTFSFNKLKPGEYFIKIQFVGYRTFKSPSIRLKSNQKVNLAKLELSLSERFLNEVRVSGQQLQSVNKIDKQIYKADQFAAAKGGTAIDVIKNMPSVSVDGQGEISVRGSKGFLVLINGKPVQTDASTILSQLPANTVENIEMITAPSAKYDPDGKGGIINITTKKGADDGVAFIVNLQGGFPSVEDYGNKESQQRYGADITFNYRKEKWDLSASANYLRNDNAGYRDGDVYTIIGDKKTSFPSLGERSFDKKNYGGRFNLAYTPSEKHHFALGFFAGHKYQDRLADIFYNNSNIQVSTGSVIGHSQYFNSNLQNKQGEFVLGNFDYTFTFDNKSSLNFSTVFEHANLYGSTKNRNIEQTDTVQNTLSTYKNPLNGFRAKVDYAINLGTGKLEAGYQYRFDEQDGTFIYQVKNTGEPDFTITPAFTGDVKASNHIHAVYGQYSGKAAKLEYVGGLRYEYASRDLNVASASNNDYKLNLNNLFPSASLLYNFEKNWKVKAGLSRRVQRTNNFEINPIPEREHSETLEQGDPELLPEFITNLETGFVKKLKAGSLFMNAYYQHSKNPIQRVNSVYADTILQRVFTNAVYSSRIGVEFGGEGKPLSWLKVNGGVNLYNFKISGQVLDYLETRNNQDLVYSLNAGIQADLSKNWSTGLQVNYLSERPTVQGYDSRFLTPHFNLSKGFMNGAITAQLQWQFIELGNWGVNEQRITTSAEDFYTTTNYIYEKNVFLINLNFNLHKLNQILKLPKSEFGEKEF